jgi:hypothetical protein
MVDFAEQLENMAIGFNYQFLDDASPVPSALCQFRGAVLEYDPVVHRIEVIFETLPYDS